MTRVVGGFLLLALLIFVLIAVWYVQSWKRNVLKTMSNYIEPLYVDCGQHGNRVASVMCCHLLNTKDKAFGFIENSSEPNDLQAWCYSCEEVFEQEGEMTERFRDFNNASIVCVKCYEYLARFHTIDK